MCRLTAGWLRWSSSAAREKLPWLTTACRVRRCAKFSSMGRAKVFLIVWIMTIDFADARSSARVIDRRWAMPETLIRFAAEADAEAVCTIYNQGIEERIATLETELRTPDERRQWLAARGTRHPVIVAEQAGVVAGWASLNPFNPRRAYDHVADLSVYVERGSRGKGVGRRLLGRIEELAREIGYHKMVLAAFPYNTAGMVLYERVGFVTVGIYREQGQLDGKWVDVIIMEKLLAG